MIWLSKPGVNLGSLPSMLSEDDPRPAKEQFNSGYCAGWQPFEGFKLVDGRLEYPGDPPLEPLATAIFRDERILVYPHDWVVIVQPDMSFEVCRMD